MEWHGTFNMLNACVVIDMQIWRLETPTFLTNWEILHEGIRLQTQKTEHAGRSRLPLTIPCSKLSLFDHVFIH
jgi:hypothetical protein